MMYFDYLKERHGYDAVEFDHGFAVFSARGSDFFVHELYVAPSARRGKLATEIVTHLEEIAKMNGCNKIWGSVPLSANGATEALHFHLAIGGKIHSAESGVIVTYKEL
jgi:GNAT superfamily N-acetyltransferase